MQEFLNKLGIHETPQRANDGSYVIDIADSNEFGKYFSKLDRSDLVEESEESSQVTLDNSNITYLSENYTLQLISNFNEDIYKLVIREN